MKLLLPLSCRINTNTLFGCAKLIGYLASAVNVLSSNPCVGPLPENNREKHRGAQRSLYQLQKNDIFPMPPSVNETFEQELNPMLRLLYLYLPGSTFLASFTDQNKQFCNLKSVFKFLNHGFSV